MLRSVRSSFQRQAAVASRPVYGGRGVAVRLAPTLSATSAGIVTVTANSPAFAVPVAGWTLSHGPSPRYYSDYPDHIPVAMPKLSPTMTDGAIGEWAVSVGDEVAAGDLLVQIRTDKAMVDLNAPEDGFIAKILAEDGAEGVPVKQLIAVIVEDEADVEAFAEYEAPDAPIDEGDDEAADSEPEPASKSTASSSSTSASSTPSSSSGPSTSSGRVPATPLARRLAAERSVRLEELRGTGPNARVVAADVESAPAGGASRSAAPSPPISAGVGLTYEDIPTDPTRRVIAERLTESKQTIPHFYLTADCRVDSLLGLRKELNDASDGDYKLSVNDFIVKASALALRKIPEVNSSWHGDFIRRYNSADVCVAVDTGNGLITPIVTSADLRGLASISGAVKDLAVRAREGKLKPEEFQGGTFTISNLGMFGVPQFAAIINPPQACILAVGSAVEKVVVGAKGDFEVANMMSVTLSCDHRVVDGAVGARWLSAFRAYIENPKTMLL